MNDAARAGAGRGPGQRHRNARALRRVAIGLVIGAAACGGDDFDPPSRITSLRVVAVRADAPYAAPEKVVHVDALAHDPAGRAVTIGWGTCVDTPSLGVADCIDSMDRASWTVGDATSHEVTIPADAITRLPPDGAARGFVGVVVVACPGALALGGAGRIEGTGDLPFECRDAVTGRLFGTDEYVVGTKRIFARAKDVNANPVVSGVTWDGADWPESEVKNVQPCAIDGNGYDDCNSALTHEVSVVVPPASVESGVDSFGAPFHEQVVVQYYATEGTFKHAVRAVSDASTGWVARTASAGRLVTMWLVVRDDRGGVTWATRTVQVGAL